jgi:hypothetical protein
MGSHVVKINYVIVKLCVIKRIELLLTQRYGYYQIHSWSSEFHLPIQERKNKDSKMLRRYIL